MAGPESVLKRSHCSHAHSIIQGDAICIVQDGVHLPFNHGKLSILATPFNHGKLSILATPFSHGKLSILATPIMHGKLSILATPIMHGLAGAYHDA